MELIEAIKGQRSIRARVENVIYDNKIGTPDDDMESGTTLGGGTIIIHTIKVKK